MKKFKMNLRYTPLYGDSKLLYKERIVEAESIDEAHRETADQEYMVQILSCEEIA